MTLTIRAMASSMSSLLVCWLKLTRTTRRVSWADSPSAINDGEASGARALQAAPKPTATPA